MINKMGKIKTGQIIGIGVLVIISILIQFVSPKNWDYLNVTIPVDTNVFGEPISPSFPTALYVLLPVMLIISFVLVLLPNKEEEDLKEND